MTKRKRVPPKGAEVFTFSANDERPIFLIPVGGKILWGRFPRLPKLREVSDDEYGGGPRNNGPTTPEAA